MLAIVRRLAGWIGLVASLLCWVLPVRADGAWSVPLQLSAAEQNVAAACLAEDSTGTLHAVWSADGSLYHRLRLGSAWSAAETVTTGESPTLAADSAGRVHLVAVQNGADAADLVHLTLETTGQWSLPEVIAESVNQILTPSITIGPGDRLAVAWCEAASQTELVYLAEYGDDEVWDMGPVPNGYGTRPVAAYDVTGALVVAWEDVFDLGFPLEIMAARRAGETWGLPVDVSYSPLANSSWPDLAASAAGLYLVWEEAEESGVAVYGASLEGDLWGEPQALSGAGEVCCPSVDFGASGTGYLLWGDGSTLTGAVSTSSGATWTSQAGPQSISGTVLAVDLLAGVRPYALWVEESPSDLLGSLHFAEFTATTAQNRVYLPLVLGP